MAAATHSTNNNIQKNKYIQLIYNKLLHVEPQASNMASRNQGKATVSSSSRPSAKQAVTTKMTSVL
jgi:hypothetical protein